MIAWLVVIVMVVGIVLALIAFSKRHAEQRRIHDQRLKAMANVTIAAMKKKAALEQKEPTPAQTSAPIREERECPYCAEPILKRARVCKHCGRDVEPLA